MTMGEEIDRLREVRDSQALEIERLRAVLKPFADLAAKLDSAPNLIGILTEEDWRRAARAFNGEQTPKRGEIIKCTQCGGPVAFGDCCNACDKPTDE